jgi:probable F420-dependent oxidoreductase
VRASPPAHRFRFGVVCRALRSRTAWLTTARRAETLGYSTLLIPDHLGDQFAPAPALQAAADATTRLRVGSLVFANDFRHPVVLAKEAATLDVLSDGRFELGIGGGWLRAEYTQAGIPFDPPGVRITRLEEALRVLKALFADGRASFAGAHYTVNGLEGLPKPVQRPHPSLLIGGGGRRLLTLAAREADIVSIIPRAQREGAGLDLADASAAAFAEKVEWVRAAAAERFQRLELSTLVQVVEVTTDRRAAAGRIAPRFQATAEDMLDMPYALIGTTEEIARDLRRVRERHGVTYVVVFEPAMDVLAPVVARLAGT